ncbi:hypothetical protein CLV51_102882 [Chitinophaga niastensis]|uniref:Uncharacterized protein n=1 Tax=Chitinophaga niastensis TaxID=536980 RepID=A0A2P8HP70_CHINA|nr:hypothetical protein [Chitinophaga niastensis]PSL48022.1 hypothetical protein CLV51_102882 [Chitinophaga niastensis]
MKITEIRILPPFAVARLGSSPTPLAAYDLEIPADKPLGFRKIVPQPTFTVDPTTHEISVDKPTEIIFKDAQDTKDTSGTIRPVAPFLEVFAITDEKPGVLVPLTTDLLELAGYHVEDIVWIVYLYNSKIMRRTNNDGDNIMATVAIHNDFAPRQVMAACANFLPGKKLPLGTVQFIKPSKEFPQIRFRYTPGGGKVYGSSLNSIKAEGQPPTPDPNIKNASYVLYDPTKPWASYSESPDFNPNYTMPAQIFAGYADNAGNQHSWGYIDDECDGTIIFNIGPTERPILIASAHVCAGPPAFAPDILPIRAISDELEQILMGTDREGEVSIDEAEEIVRRAIESITLMNTAVMNGNPINGRWNVASTMVRQDTNDFGRLFEPIMASSIVDNLALRSLHERVFNGLSTGMAAWFADALRRPDKIGDLSDKERRKMPGLMRGADGRGLTLTYRMINTVIQAAASAMFRDNVNASTQATQHTESIKANDFNAQLHYRGHGNPYSVLSRAAISNCFPGLESDFRNLWRHIFLDLTISENDNYVLHDSTDRKLQGRRIVGINGKPTMVMGEGPVFPGGDSVPLTTKDNPNGAAFMEWSNFFASLGVKGGDTLTLQFTPGEATLPVLVTAEQLKDTTAFPAYTFIMREIFTPNKAEISRALLRPGELTQGLCAPWQNDYRECACYYWAATRPDYVNVEPGDNGLSKGDMWLAKRRTGEYVPDNRVDTRLFSYNDLFQNWEGELNFIINGRDALSSGNTNNKEASINNNKNKQ